MHLGILGSGNVGGTPPVVAVAAVPSPACRPDPMANVYHRDRLKVIDACRTVSQRVRREASTVRG